jgi:hypothetical protein
VVRYIILATIVFVGLSLACSPAMAEEPQDGSSSATIEEAQNAVVVPAPTTHRKRLSTRDRWRGTPYLRGGMETLPSQGSDVVLPPANANFQGGGILRGAGL